MSDYDYELRGVLFKNDKKGNENAPDYKGNATIHGVDFWVAGWIKTPQNGGDKFMSLAYTKKDAPPAQEAARPAQGDEIPF